MLKKLKKEGFSVKLNALHAIGQSLANAAGALLIMNSFGTQNNLVLVAAAVWGFFHGSLSELISWNRNKEAINSFNKEPQEN